MDDSSESECGQYDCNEQEVELTPARLDNQALLRESRNRDSGPYENVTPTSQIISKSTKQVSGCRLPESVMDFVMVESPGGEEALVKNNRTGLHTLRNILTTGQTSNV